MAPDRAKPQGLDDRYRLDIRNDSFGFSGAHFITFRGHECEMLHGHNYRMGIALEGPINESGYVVDFSRIKSMVRAMLSRYDHKVLLATNNPDVVISEEGSAVTARYADFRYVFPAAGTLLLPVRNTTVEMLAHHFALEFDRAVSEGEPEAVIDWVEVDVEERPHQSAAFRLRRGDV